MRCLGRHSSCQIARTAERPTGLGKTADSIWSLVVPPSHDLKHYTYAPPCRICGRGSCENDCRNEHVTGDVQGMFNWDPSCTVVSDTGQLPPLESARMAGKALTSARQSQSISKRLLAQNTIPAVASSADSADAQARADEVRG